MRLNPDTLGAGFSPVPQGFEMAMERAFTQIRRAAAQRPPRPCGRKLSFALTLVLILALAGAAVTAALLGGVLRFNDDLLEDHESGVLTGAEGLVQKDLGRVDFGHVTLEVVEAAYDGQELRLVYALTDPAVATAYPDNPWQTLEEMAGLEADGLWASCDGADIDGQDISWNHERLSGTDTPGRVLFYKRSTLPAWGVKTPTGPFTLRLHLRKNTPLSEQPGFVIQAAPANRLARVGRADPFQKDGLAVELTRAVFTPLRGTIGLRFTLEGAADGAATYRAAEPWLTGDNLLLPDGTALAAEGQGFDPASPVLEVLMLLDPPPAGWPERLTFQSTNGDKMEVLIP